MVPSWLDKYNNCHLLLNPSPTQSDDVSFTKVQDVVTNARDFVMDALQKWVRQCKTIAYPHSNSYISFFDRCGTNEHTIFYRK